MRTRPTALAAASIGLAVAGIAAMTPVAVDASSHREAPLIAGAPRLDNTDLYAFVSPDNPDTVTIIANWTPFEEPNGGPNFYPFATPTAHDVNIDNDGDARPDITYRWTFTSHYKNRDTFLYNTGPVTSLDDPDLNFTQTYTLKKITEHGTQVLLKDAPVAPSFVGPASMPDYQSLTDAAVVGVSEGGKSFAGQADDPFFLDLRVFDLLYGGDFSEVGHDTLAGYNVNTIALQVRKHELALNNSVQRNPVVGLWTTTATRGIDLADAEEDADTEGKSWRQVSRLGMPLVNEVVIPVGKKNEFNSSRPVNDERFLQFVTEPEVPVLVEAIYGIPAPPTPREDLVEVFLTGLCSACGPVAADLNSQLLNKDVDPDRFQASEQLRLNMSIPPSANPSRLGVIDGDLAGFPNGRRLADDVIDITLRVAEGILLPNPPPAVTTLSDAVDTNDHPFRTTFPYLALSNMDAVNQ